MIIAVIDSGYIWLDHNLYVISYSNKEVYKTFQTS